MNHHAGGFVDHDDVLVLVYDFDRDRLGADVGPGPGPRADRDRFIAPQAESGLDPLSVYGDFSSLDPLLEALAREFDTSAESIRNSVKQSDRDESRRSDGLTTDERDEIRRLKRENRRLGAGAGDSAKGRGLVRSGDRHDTETVFRFMKANITFSIRLASI